MRSYDHMILAFETFVVKLASKWQADELVTLLRHIAALNIQGD